MTENRKITFNLDVYVNDDLKFSIPYRVKYPYNVYDLKKFISDKFNFDKHDVIEVTVRNSLGRILSENDNNYEIQNGDDVSVEILTHKLPSKLPSPSSSPPPMMLPKSQLMKTPPPTTGKHTNESSPELELVDKEMFDHVHGGNVISTIEERPSVNVRPKILTSIDKEKCSINTKLFNEEQYDFFNEDELVFFKRNVLQGLEHVTDKMFRVVADWLHSLYVKFGASPDTYFLAVSLIVDFLGKSGDDARKENFQLIGVTCFWIAAKFEEIYPPDLRDLAFVTNNTSDKDDIIAMEKQILMAINFIIFRPTIYTFLVYYLHVAKASKKAKIIAKYISERISEESLFHNYLPSELAAATVYLSLKKDEKLQWTDCLIYYTKYSEEHILPIANKIEKFLQENNKPDNSVQETYTPEEIPSLFFPKKPRKIHFLFDRFSK